MGNTFEDLKSPSNTSQALCIVPASLLSLVVMVISYSGVGIMVTSEVGIMVTSEVGREVGFRVW